MYLILIKIIAPSVNTGIGYLGMNSMIILNGKSSRLQALKHIQTSRPKVSYG